MLTIKVPGGEGGLGGGDDCLGGGDNGLVSWDAGPVDGGVGPVGVDSGFSVSVTSLVSERLSLPEVSLSDTPKGQENVVTTTQRLSEVCPCLQQCRVLGPWWGLQHEGSSLA